MKIAVVGTGYVGLVSGTCFAETGTIVTCVDVNEKKISQLNSGIIPIYEPGLENMVKRNVEKQRLFFTTNLKDAMVGAEAIFIAVGTPPDEDGSADLKHVLTVASEIGRNLQVYTVVVNKSTVPVGTAQKVKNVIKQELEKRGVNIPFDVASNPEFLKEGNAIDDFLKPDRIVVGTESEEAQKLMGKLYKPFLLNGHPIVFMDLLSSELTKYAANAMLATKISFINDIANLCEIVGADVNLVRKGIGSDSRIGNKFIYAGAGYGGSCFPKDVKALIKTAQDHNHTLEILKSVESVNERQKQIVYHRVKDFFNGNLKGKKIAMWGLSFKPNTDDMREAPSVVIIESLLKDGATVSAYDPVAINEAKRILGDTIQYATSPYEATKNADALILITEWSEFRIINFEELEKNMNQKVIFDGRNIYDPEEMRERGYVYYSIGRKPINGPK
ncbi:UDP-glucose/GDP-mannose dehydrogenase family protein [uncultured Acetobacteroides sp.]|uniref:UDP-glucose dehydrogenase family protein n=1 Tax=uncultured Acetobacteroides sp. TaxID=1760811 RepID=UPI0029F59C76|nr:UDP-glucose/GDP-mannose dehydrogenase family protein [uncultured Acetobacteroides sp.]